MYLSAFFSSTTIFGVYHYFLYSWWTAFQKEFFQWYCEYIISEYIITLSVYIITYYYIVNILLVSSLDLWTTIILLFLLFMYQVVWNKIIFMLQYTRKNLYVAITNWNWSWNLFINVQTSVYNYRYFLFDKIPNQIPTKCPWKFLFCN